MTREVLAIGAALDALALTLAEIRERLERASARLDGVKTYGGTVYEVW